MDKPRATPKDFFLWAGAMIALWSGIIAFLALIFDYINYVFPDVLNTYYYSDPYSSVSYEMASLIVLAPVFLILMRVIRRSIANDATRAEIWVRRWALYLTLFVAGSTIVVDLIVLITTFLSGQDLSVRFLLKVLVVLLVAAAGFMHFLADIWGYWMKYPLRARSVNWATGILVILTIVVGFFIVGTPQQARQYRLDEQKLQDLQSVQSQVVYYYQQKQKIPAQLADLNDSLSYFTVPVDPQTGEAYGYTVKSSLSFELCANFNHEMRAGGTGMNIARPTMPYGVKGGEDNWQHGIGQKCFVRTIDPELYPLAPKGLQ